MYQEVFKKIFDVLLALFLFILVLPLMIIIYLIIKKDSEGSALFIQERTGKKGQPFKMYKFRTMIIETERNGRPLTHEERVTKVGGFLRRTSLDELPQIINVIKGEMSFIGPRPWLPEYYLKYNDKQKKRVDVLPGISGLAQVKGRNGISIFDKINYDIEYAENISFLLDMKITLLTIAVIFKRQHAEISQEKINEELQLLNE
jgi:undecaprenyl phosphate N,N'-diacetylbacillosamine 1-phosphate transferase